MASTALTTAGRFPVRRKRPNRPPVDNASRSSWCPRYGVRFTLRRFCGKSFRLRGLVFFLSREWEGAFPVCPAC